MTDGDRTGLLIDPVRKSLIEHSLLGKVREMSFLDKDIDVSVSREFVAPLLMSELICL